MSPNQPVKCEFIESGAEITCTVGEITLCVTAWHFEKGELRATLDLKNARALPIRDTVILDREKSRKEFIGKVKLSRDKADLLHNALLQLADFLRALTAKKTVVATQSPTDITERFQATESGLFLLKETGPCQLTNFTAKIISDIMEDDGAEIHRAFEIEVSLGKHTVKFTISAASFSQLAWVLEKLGAGAYIVPGMSAKDQVRAAIQATSKDVVRKTVYTHIGFRKIDGQWVYLTAGTCIGPEGPIDGVQVSLPPNLASYALPVPPSDEELRPKILESIKILDLAPLKVTVPGLGAVYRAPLGGSDFGVHIDGDSGEGKTELAVVFQQYYGRGFHSRNVPANWQSTGNALEMTAYLAKDALMTVDDLAPQPSAYATQKLFQTVEQAFRGQGNNSGRLRLRSDITLRPPKFPRGLILSTGEEMPRGRSLRARAFMVTLPKGSMDWSLLSVCKEKAREGVYEAVFVAYIQWLAQRYEQIQESRHHDIEELRKFASSDKSAHKRTPDIVANLALGLKYFLQFAMEKEALTKEEAHVHWDQWWAALGEVSHAQALYQEEIDPVNLFLEFLPSCISAGKVHLASIEGEEPEDPQAWGWRKVKVGSGDSEREEWRPQGPRVGWVKEKDVYLNFDAAFAEIQKLARDAGQQLSISPDTLKKRLAERKILKSVNEKRGLKVRKIVENKRLPVIHLDRSIFGFDGLNSDPEDTFPSLGDIVAPSVESSEETASGANGQVGQCFLDERDPAEPKPEKQNSKKEGEFIF